MGKCGWNFSLTNLEYQRREPQSFGANEKIYSTQAWNNYSKSILGALLSRNSSIQDLKSKCERFTGLNSFVKVISMCYHRW